MHANFLLSLGKIEILLESLSSDCQTSLFHQEKLSELLQTPSDVKYISMKLGNLRCTKTRFVSNHLKRENLKTFWSLIKYLSIFNTEASENLSLLLKMKREIFQSKMTRFLHFQKTMLSMQKIYQSKWLLIFSELFNVWWFGNLSSTSHEET